MRNKVRNSILKLDIKYKEVIFLRYYNELSCNEIANKLNLNVNTVITRINRAKRILNNLLKAEGETYE
ncbi:RNA polymerase sigma factor [Tepidibacter formicigenes]|uniref:RNA polymerase sigma factor n=1 Tax=Tepidibacter formicigenes TaxID=227138 RepID=UPI00241F4C5E|nr:sigma factor-like helix-turn-helix DNA-binding protein [Tepidibacter formicigenes]